MYTKLLIFATLALFTACQPSKSIKDDWPGIDDKSFKLKNNTSTLSNKKSNVFSLTTQILLPKMGFDVHYTITSICTRILPALSRKKMIYSKKTIYPATKSQSPTPLQIFEHLPEEMIIFPEHFSKCDFKLDTRNQNNSIDSALLKDQVFKTSPDEHHISIIRKQEFKKKHPLPLKTEFFSEFIVKSLDSKPMRNLEVMCYTNNVKLGKTLNISHSKLSAKKILLPKETKDIPLEYCRLKAVCEHTKKVIFSPVFKFINRDELPIVKDHDNSKNPISSFKKTIHYNSNYFIDTLTLFKINFTNTSNKDSLNVHINKEDSMEDIFLITGLKKISSSKPKNSYYKTIIYAPFLSPVSTRFAWIAPSTGNTVSTIRIKPKKTKTLEFQVFPSFECSDNTELGFIIAPEKNNPLFTYSLMNKNDFVSEPIYTKSILYSDTSRISIDNLPDKISKKFLNSSDFQLYFRNQNVQPNKEIPFVFHIFEPGFGKNGEISRQHEEQLAKAPRFHFSKYVYQKNYAECMSF